MLSGPVPSDSINEPARPLLFSSKVNSAAAFPSSAVSLLSSKASLLSSMAHSSSAILDRAYNTASAVLFAKTTSCHWSERMLGMVSGRQFPLALPFVIPIFLFSSGSSWCLSPPLLISVRLVQSALVARFDCHLCHLSRCFLSLCTAAPHPPPYCSLLILPSYHTHLGFCKPV